MNAIKTFFAVLLMFTVQNIQAQFPAFNWAMGSTSTIGSRIVSSSAVDAFGNCYIAGTFGNTITLGNTTFTLTSSTNIGFIAKVNAQGNAVWLKRLQSNNTCSVNKILLDNNGNLLACGSFNVSIQFTTPTGLQAFNSLGQSDMFLTKMDTAGNHIWVNHFGGNGFDRAKALVTDNSGAIYLAGEFANTVDFNPLPNAISNLTSLGADDNVIAKYNVNGDYIWAQSIGNILSDNVNDIVCRGNELIITGSFNGNVDFNPSSAVDTLNSANKIAGFVAKYDTAFNYIWAKMIKGTNASGSNDCEGRKVKWNASGEVIVMGKYRGTVDLNPSPNATALFTNPVAYDAFILKLNTVGAYVWGFNLGQNFDCIANDISIDAANSIYVCGGFSGVVDFDPGAATFSLTGTLNNSYDAFIAKYTNAGVFSTALMVGTSASIDEASAIHVTATGDIYTAGRYGGVVNFNTDPGGTPFNLGFPSVPSNFSQIFVHRMGNNTSVSLNDLNLKKSFNVHPIPCKDQLFIQTSTLGLLSYDMTDVTGRMIIPKTTREVSNGQLNIDLDQYSSGIYILTINTNNTIYKKQIIIEK
jgi:hypothetical protein